MYPKTLYHEYSTLPTTVYDHDGEYIARTKGFTVESLPEVVSDATIEAETVQDAPKRGRPPKVVEEA